MEEIYPDVEVLLGTYNGEKYIANFLDSLKNQSSVRIHLRVSDDGSSDKTKDIVLQYANTFATFNFQEGRQRGAKNNYFDLIQKSRQFYIALADQDDIWYPDHLISSINRLKSYGNTPALTYSKVNQKIDGIEILWPTMKKLDFESFIFENHARGCTMVFNQVFVEKLFIRSESAIMHDWWLAMIASNFKVLSCSDVPEIEYRLHENNHVGVKRSIKVKFSTFIHNRKLRDWPILNQLKEFLDIYGDPIVKRNRRSLYLRRMQRYKFIHRLTYSLKLRRFRTKISDEFLLRILLIMSWRLQEKNGS